MKTEFNHGSSLLTVGQSLADLPEGSLVFKPANYEQLEAAVNGGATIINITSTTFQDDAVGLKGIIGGKHFTTVNLTNATGAAGQPLINDASLKSILDGIDCDTLMIGSNGLTEDSVQTILDALDSGQLKANTIEIGASGIGEKGIDDLVQHGLNIVDAGGTMHVLGGNDNYNHDFSLVQFHTPVVQDL